MFKKMKVECVNNYKVFYSFLSRGLSLKIHEAFNFAQNNATEYFKNFNGDNMNVRKKDNAVWVVSKSRMHIFKGVSWLETLKGESYTSLVKNIRVETETKFTDKNNELVFVVGHQHCPLNMDTRKIIKVDEITFPKDMDEDPTLFEGDYLKLHDKFEESDFVYEQKVFSQDIDYSNHANNVAYIRFIMNSLSNDFLDSINITDVEIHYLAESKEGQTLRIYKKEIENNELRFLIKEGERDVIKASIKYELK